MLLTVSRAYIRPASAVGQYPRDGKAPANQPREGMAHGERIEFHPQTPLGAAMTGEFLGTALLILLGDGVVANVFLLNKQPDNMMITTGWGLAVALAVYVSGRLSGGHINPAVTLALASRGDFPRSRVFPYWGAQLAGAFVGALLVYADYAEAFPAFETRLRT